MEGFFDQIILYSGISLPSLVELLDFLSLLAQITQMSCCVDWVLWRRIFQENNNKKKRGIGNCSKELLNNGSSSFNVGGSLVYEVSYCSYMIKSLICLLLLLLLFYL